MTTNELRAEFQKQTGFAPVFANRFPYVTYIEWLEKQLKQVKNIAYEPVLATVNFVYIGEHEEKGGGRPFLNQLTGKFFYRKDLQRYFTDTQIATIKPYGG